MQEVSNCVSGSVQLCVRKSAVQIYASQLNCVGQASCSFMRGFQYVVYAQLKFKTCEINSSLPTSIIPTLVRNQRQ